MKRAHLTALVATLAMGALAAPRLAAQDTSAAGGQMRPDTSGYTGAGGVDTSSGAGRAGATNPAGGAADTSTGTSPSLRDAPGRVDATDTTGALGATDTSGMNGRHPDTTRVGDTRPAKPARHAADKGKKAKTKTKSRADSGSTGRESTDTAGMAQPTTQPSQSTSPSTGTSDSTRSQ